MKELKIERIMYQWSNPHGIWVLLKEKRGQRHIPIVVGQFEGTALLRAVEGVNQMRPFTHDLLAAMLGDLGVSVRHITLTEWRAENQTFYAVIVVEENGTIHSIDARPSDALVLAVKKKVPIFAEETLLQIEGKAKPRRGTAAEAVSAPPTVTLWPKEQRNSSQPKAQKKKPGRHQ